MTTQAPLYAGIGDQVATFSQKMIRQTKGRWAGRPLIFEPWQREFVNELYLRDEDGNNVYREALLGLPRKNGKSTMAAAIALYGLLASGEPGAEVYAAAGSKDQARIVFNQAKEFVEASPRLRDWLRPQRSAILCPSNSGVFRVLASDAPLQHGLNPFLVVIDELWAHDNPELYYALTTGQLARENPLIVSITTAGFDRETVLWQVYEHGRKLFREGPEAMRREQFLFRWYQGEDGCSLDDREQWEAANPSSWIRENLDQLARERNRLPEFVFRRLHLNQWTAIEDAWIDAPSWDACAGEPRFEPSEPAWLTVDVGIKRDSTAIVWAQWHDDYLHVGQRILDQDSDPGFGRADVREHVAERAAPFDALEEAAYDPWGFAESAEELEERGLPMVRFDQGAANMGPASEHTYELVKEGRIVHDGDPRAREQVLAAVVAPTERGWRISKRKSKKRIDFTVALAMAVERAIQGKVAESYDRAAW